MTYFMVTSFYSIWLSILQKLVWGNSPILALLHGNYPVISETTIYFKTLCSVPEINLSMFSDIVSAHGR